MKKTIIPLVISIVFASSLYAQEISGIAIFSKIGYTALPGSATILNKMAPFGNKFSNNFIAFGAEGYYRDNKNIFILDGNIGAQTAKSTYANGARAFFGAGYAKFGRIINEKKHYLLYPSLGVGIAAIDINTYNTANDEVTNLQNKLLSSPSLDIGFNADYIVNKITDRDSYGALLFGLRTGYRLSARHSAWRDNGGNKLRDMPSYGYNGFYIMVTIGGGAYVRK